MGIAHRDKCLLLLHGRRVINATCFAISINTRVTACVIRVIITRIPHKTFSMYTECARITLWGWTFLFPEQVNKTILICNHYNYYIFMYLCMTYYVYALTSNWKICFVLIDIDTTATYNILSEIVYDGTYRVHK